MAEEKEKEKSGGGTKEAGEKITVLIIALVFISFVLYQLGDGERGNLIGNIRGWYDNFFIDTDLGLFFERLIFWLKFASTYISLLFLIGIVYVVTKLTAVYKEEKKAYQKPAQAESFEKREEKKWQVIEKHLDSPNASDWRLAILEADIMLEEVMEKNGYLGDTLGDKLKNIDKNEFPPLDQAWEAHKIRNLIAHEGSSFLISQREAKRIIGLYKEVLKHTGGLE